jgi:TP901 family phage tail tape measure protein
MVRQGLLGISVATGTSTDALVKSMFLVESAGFRGAAGLHLEEIAAEGAKVGNADLAQTTDVLTTTLHDYHLAVSQAVPTMNFLISSVKNGKMTMDSLNQSLTTVLPVASALHVPLASVAGALDTMAMSGDKGAGAGTHLAMMFKMLANPASTASKEMAAMGINSIKLAETMRTSLPDALKMIQDAVSKHFVAGSVEYNRAIASILGGSKSGIAGLEIMGGSFKDLVANTNAAAHALKSGGSAVTGWKLVQEDFNTVMDQGKAAFNALAITLGTMLLPVVTGIVSHVAPAISAFTQWITSGNNLSNALHTLAPVLIAIGIVILGTVVPAVWSLAVGVIAATWPVLAIIAAIAGAIAIFKHFYDTSAPFRAFIDNIVTGFKNLWTLIQANFMPVMHQLGNFFQSTILPALKQVGSFLLSTFKPAWDQLVTTWKQNLWPALQMLWGLFQMLLPVLKVVGIVILAVVVVALVIFVATVALVLKWLALLIQGWAWLVSFTGAAFSAIGTTITNFKNLVGNIFNAIGTFIHDKIMWIYNHNIYVHEFVVLIVKFFTDLRNQVGSIFSAIGTFIHDRLNWISGVVTIFKNLVGQSFSDLGTSIHDKITTVWNWLVGFVSGWPSQAVQWGINLIQGFINGIGNMIGGVKQAAQNVISTIGHFLGFMSPAREGEGRYIIQWGEGMVSGFVKGMQNKMPLLNGQISHMIAAPNLAYGGSSFSSANNSHMNITVQLDSRKMMQALGVRQAKEIRIQGNYKSN